MSPALAGGFFTTEPPGKPGAGFYLLKIYPGSQELVKKKISFGFLTVYLFYVALVCF